ncbi:MAG TPA: ferrochelatase, partial [Myxococcota bacterium]|nr:ferrochelatase [Myxococcota bacterium]
KTGVLLVNLGTPRSPKTGDVRRYLREFLSDPRVLDLAAPLRFALVNFLIAPFRAPRSAAAYRKIWDGASGSPLLAHGRALRDALARELGPGVEVELGMRYGEPALAAALDRLCAAGVARVVVLPLFPQYASSSLGSALARLYQMAAARSDVPELEVRGAFYDAPGFIAAAAEIARPRLAAFHPDHVLFSYHGLPERHVRASDRSGRHCLMSESCCDAVGEVNAHCYRAQCAATTRALAAALGLAQGAFSTSFQSRLGREPWLRPYTDLRLGELARAGVKRLAVLCPSFAADCLETLEEIGLRGREHWREAGGEALELVPCVNAHPSFVRFLAERVRGARPR